MLRTLKFIAIILVLLLTVGGGSAIKLTNKMESVSFKHKVEKSLEKLFKLNPNKHRLKIGQINTNIFSNKIKISPILITNENNKAIYSIKHLNIRFNPLKAVLKPSFKVSFNMLSSKNEKLHGKAIISNLKSKFKNKAAITNMESFQLQTLFALSSYK